LILLEFPSRRTYNFFAGSREIIVMPRPCQPITVVLADDTLMGCQLLIDAIQRGDQFRVVGCAIAREEVLSLLRAEQPDIALISSRLQDGALAGLLVLQELRNWKTRPRVIMLLDDDQPKIVVELFLNGARGIFSRTEVAAKLRKCIRCVYEGQVWASNSHLEHVVEAVMQAPVPAPAPANPTMLRVLSKREEEIARLVAGGLSNHEVAQRLSLSQHTVKNYLFRVFEKTGVSTRIELVLYILSRGKRSESQVGENEEMTFRMRA
jgi:DNA-binding NarL/FixJ family response regulator